MIFGNLGNMKEMMKMARDMQKQLKEVKGELERAVYEESAHGVSAKVSGDMEIKEIKIDPQMLDPHKAAHLERAVRDAVGKALKTAKDDATRKMKGVTGGMNLPGMQ